ncbi:MAG: DUF4176 domain-containing protein [Streptococcaceae bacterium]|jgi:hypothetical protein|nr:DUF4176 domain-containing protein [Streptococcaceae bacterium]
MTEEKGFRFLPLGTFIKVKNQKDKIFIIVARALQKDEERIFAKYRLAEHPGGAKPKSELLIVPDDEVSEILHQGFENEADVDFLTDITEKVNQSVLAPPKQEDDIPEPDLTIDLSLPVTSTSGNVNEVAKESSEEEAKKLEEDPFYKFRIEGEN